MNLCSQASDHNLVEMNTTMKKKDSGNRKILNINKGVGDQTVVSDPTSYGALVVAVTTMRTDLSKRIQKRKEAMFLGHREESITLSFSVFRGRQIEDVYNDIRTYTKSENWKQQARRMLGNHLSML